MVEHTFRVFMLIFVGRGMFNATNTLIVCIYIWQ